MAAGGGGGSKKGGTSGGRRDTSGAPGGGVGRSRGGLTGESDTAKRNRERTGFKDPTQESRDRARGYKPGTLKPDEVPTYSKLPTPGQLFSAIGMSPTSPTGAMTAIGSVVGAANINDPFGRGPLGKTIDDAMGAKPGDYSGGTNISRDSGRYGGSGQSGSALETEERKRRRAQAMQTALGADPNSLLGPGVLAI